MSMMFPGDEILEIMRNASRRVVIAAPYIKSKTITRILNEIPSTVEEIHCVTRWLPEDIALGVCDIEIFNDIERINGGRLWVHPHLHAKYYSNGRTTLVGSANLTSRGLGWRSPSNVELLVELPSKFPGLADWESALIASAVEVDKQLRDELRVQAERIEKPLPAHVTPEVGIGEGEWVALWVPQSRAPHRLWEIYQGGGTGEMAASALKAAQEDINALSPPRGLSEKKFKKYLAGILRQMPLIVEIDKMATRGLDDSKACAFLREFTNGKLEHSSDFGDMWFVVREWLTYFFPEDYRVESIQHVLIKERKISRM